MDGPFGYIKRGANVLMYPSYFSQALKRYPCIGLKHHLCFDFLFYFILFGFSKKKKMMPKAITLPSTWTHQNKKLTKVDTNVIAYSHIMAKCFCQSLDILKVLHLSKL